MTTEVPVDEQPQTTSNSGEFGQSEYGQRLTFEEPESGCMAGWKDKGWAIFYYIHVTLMVALAIALPITADPSSLNGSSTTTTTTNTGTGTTTTTTLSPEQQAAINKIVTKIVTSIVIIILLQCIVGVLFGLLWLKVMQKFAQFIIKFMLFLVLVLWAVIALLGFILFDPANYGLVAVGAIMFLIQGLYIWCIWSRIPFSSALLMIASAITQTFEGTICIAFLVIPMNVLWNFIWSFSMYGFILDSNIKGGIRNLIYFLLLISFYWGIQVNKNVSHTTTCGVAATWYFSKEVHKPTMPAFKRSMTTSFGSIAFGSFIVAVLQATKSLVKSMASGRGNILACICILILACIERLVRYFNMYAFAQCAIYGSDFITSAKATWSLFLSKGFDAIINDDLTGLALFAGSFLSLVVCFFVGWFLTLAFFPTAEWGYLTLPIQIIVGIYGGLIGFYLCYTILMVVRSSIVCLFVCFAEDPNAMSQNRPDEFKMLVDAKAELNTFATTGHTGVGAEIEQQQKQQQG